MHTPIFHDGDFCFSFSTHTVCEYYLLHVKSYESSRTFLFSGPFVWVPPLSILMMVSSISETAQDLVFFMRFLLESCVLRSFFVLPMYDFLIFLSLLLVCWCPFSIFSTTCVFSFKRSESFLIKQFSSFRHFYFHKFYHEYDVFFYAKFHSFIFTVYSSCLYQTHLFSSLLLFFFFCKLLDIVHFHKAIKLFLWF